MQNSTNLTNVTTPAFISNKINRWVLITLTAVIALFSSLNSFSQTTLISSTGNGGFETGTTPAANNWTAVNSSIDGWYVGAVPGVSSGSKCVYISSDAGTSWTYTQFTVIQHLYYDVTIPAGQSIITLSFKWKAFGEGTTTNDYDNIKVFWGTAASMGVPVANTAIAAGFQVSGPGATSGMYKLNAAAYNAETITMSGTPGTVYRLDFSWKSDGSTIGNPPAAIDEVALVASAPSTFSATATGGLWSSPATWAAGVVPAAGNDVSVPAGSIVTVDQLTSYRNLTIDGTVQWNGTTNAMTLGGNLIINSTGSLLAYTTGATGQTINIGGNLTNNGYANLAQASTLINFNGSGSVLGGTGTFQGNGTDGIIRSLFFQNLGSNIVSTSQNIITSGLTHTGGSLNTGGKIKIDNTAQVYGLPLNIQVANLAVTNMGSAYSVAPVVFGSAVTQWSNITGTLNTLYVSGTNVYRCTTAANIGPSAPTHTSGTAQNLLWIGTTGTLGNPFLGAQAHVLGTQYFYGGNLYVCTVAGTASATTPPVHTSGSAVSGGATFLYIGSPAMATVNFDAVTATVRSLNLVSGGSGYNAAPSLVFSVGVLAGAGTGAAATAVYIQQIAGTANSLFQKSGGAATISGSLSINSDQGASIASANPQASSGVAAISTSNGGINYTVAPIVGFALPATLNLITNAGSGYTATPTVTVTGGNLVSGTALTTANFTISVNQGQVEAVYLNTGTTATYSTLPTLSLTTSPGVTATLAFPAGCLPAATAIIGSNGQLTNFTVTSAGFGYAAAPTVGIGTTSGTASGGTFTTVATAPTARIALYNLTLSFFTPAASAVVAPDDAAIPSNRKLNALTLAGNGNGLNLTGNLVLFGTTPITLTASGNTPGNILDLGGNNLLFTWNGYGGVAGTFGATNAYIKNGSMSLIGRGGASTFTYPFSGTFTWFAGTTPTANTTGSTVTKVTVTETAAPTGVGALGTRAFLVNNNAGIQGLNPTVAMNYNTVDALPTAINAPDLYIAQSTSLAGTGTPRSSSSGSGTIGTSGTRTTATSGFGPLVPTGNDYFSWTTITLNYSNVTVQPATCLATAHLVSADVTTTSGTITGVTITYNNGTATGPVAMTNTTGSTWQFTIPAASPSNTVVTWSLTATSSLGLTKTFAGTPYQDDPLNGAIASVTSSATSVCSGTPVTLTAKVNKAGGTATIGTATTLTSLTTQPTAFCNRWPSYRMQTIYTAAELTAAGLAAGNITSMAYNITSLGSAATNASFEVKIGNTSLTAFTAFVSTATGFTTVFPAATYTHAVGVNVINFSTPFVWDGVSNIIIENIHLGANSSNNSETYYTATTGNTVAYTATASSNGASFSTQRLNITFTGVGAVTLPTYTWNNGTSNIGTGNPFTTSPTTATTYTFTGTTAAGCSITSPGITVNTIALPASPGANNSTQCGTGVPAAFVTTGGGGGGFKWYSAQTGGSLLQTGGATYTTSISSTQHFWVSESNGTCESPRVEVIAAVNQPDAVSATANNTSPCVNTSIILTATDIEVTPANAYTYSWTATPQAGSGLPATATAGNPLSVTPTIPGTYTYTVAATAGSCNTSATTTTVTVKAPPQINTKTATPSTICAGANVSLAATSGTLGAGTGTIGAGASTFAGYVTTGNEGFGNPYNYWYGNQKTQYIYTQAELAAQGLSAGNITALSFEVTALGSAAYTMTGFTIGLGQTAQSVAVNAPITTLTTVYTNAAQPLSTGINNYVFSTPFTWNGTSNIVVSVCWGNSNSGATASTVTVKKDAAPFVSTTIIYTDGSIGTGICAATTGTNNTTTTNRPKVVFSAITGVDNTAANNWVWNPGNLVGSTVTVNPVTSTVYTVTVTNPSTTCSATGTVAVTVNPVPAAPSGNNGTDQCGTSLTDASVSSNNAIDPQSPPFFKWYDAATGGTLKQSGTSNTYLTPIGVTTTFYVSEVSVNGCEGPRVAITTVVSDPDPIVVSSTPAIVCLGGSASITTSYTPSFNSFATFTLTASPETGSGISGNVSLTANANGSNPYTITPTAAGTYVYTVTAVDPDKGCTSVNTVSITVGTVPVISSATATPATVCAGTAVNLTAIGSPQYRNVVVSGYNTDVVANGVGAVTASTTATFDNAEYALAAPDWNFSGSCTPLSFFLPASGKVPANSTVAPGLIYTLQPYSAMNNLRIPATGSVTTGTGTLTVASPVNMRTIYLLYGAGNGPITSGITVTVTFTDASTQVFSNLTAQDWFATTNPSISNVGRVSAITTPACAATVTGGPQLFDMALDLLPANYTKLVQSIKVDKTITGGIMNVMAVGMRAPQFQAQGYNWTWNPGAFTDSIATVTPSVTTTYTVTAANPATGCSASATTTVTVNPLPAAPSTNNPVTRCGPGSVTLTASGIDGGTLHWYAGPTGGVAVHTGSPYTINVTANTVYYVSDMSAQGCEGPRSQVNISVTTAPALAITPSGPVSFCQGGTVTLNGASGSNASYVNFAWTTSPAAGSGLSSATGAIVTAAPTVSGAYIYTLNANDGIANGCSNTATITVTANPNPVITSATATPSTTCAGGNVNLVGLTTAIGQGNGASIGTGTSLTSATSQPTAFCNRWPSYRMQLVYTAAELSASGLSAGNITSMAFNISTLGDGATNPNFVVQISPTSLSTLSTAFVSTASGFTTVYPAQTYTHTASGQQTIPFSTPFAWDGTSNILIDVQMDGADITNNSQTLYTATTGNTVAYTTTAASNAASFSTNRLNIIFSGQVQTTGAGTLNWVWNPGSLSGSTVTVNPLSSTTYTVTATNPATGCSTVSSPVTVTVTPVAATATATPNTAVCAGTTVTLNGGASGGAPFSYSWSNGTTVVGTTSPLPVIPLVTTTYTVTVTDACGNATTSSVTVNVNPLPTVTVTPTSAQFCNPGTGVTLNASGATTYTWSPATGLSATTGQTVVASPSTGTVYTVTGSDANGCTKTATATITVAVTPTATAAASPTTLCAGTPLNLTSTGTLPATGYTVGSIPVSVETPSGTPTVLATGGNAVVPYTASNAATLDDAYWNNISLPFSFGFFGNNYSTVRISSNGTVQFGAVSAGTGTTGNYTWVPQTIPTAGGNLDNFIAGPWNDMDMGTTPFGTLRYFVNGVAPNRKFVISYEAVKVYQATDNNTSQIILNENGSIDVLLLGGGFTSTTNKVIGIENAAGTLGTAPPDRNLGTWTTAADEAWRFIPNTPNLTYAWTGPNFSSTLKDPVISNPNPSNSGVYSVVITNTTTGCSSLAASTATVTVNPRPTGILSGGATYCTGQGSTATVLNIAVTGAGPWTGTLSGGTTFSGSTSPITVSVTPAATTTYTIATLNGSTCSAIAADLSGSATITVNPTPATPTVTAGGLTTFCSGGSVILTSSAATGNQWNLNGSAVPGATNQTLTVTASGNYSVTVTNESNCSATSTITTITVNPTPATPTVTAGGATTFCSGGSVILTSSAATGNQWNLNGSAVPGATNQTLTVTSSGNYSVTVTNESNCSATSTITTITVNPTPATPTVTAGGATTFCSGGSVILTSSSATGNQWNLNGSAVPGATNQTLTVTATGNYSVTVTNGSNCSATSTITAITVNPTPATPTVTAGGPTTFCSGGSVILTSSSATGNQWNLNGSAVPGATNQTLTVTSSGNYSVTVTNGSNCSATSTITVLTVNPAAANPTATVTQPTCAVATGTITVTAPLGAGTTYSLDNGPFQSSVTFSGVAAGTHILSVQTSSGCFSPANTTVTVDAQPITPIAPTVTGTVNVCPYLGTSEQITYTATAAGATTYTWTLPPNVNLISGGTGTDHVTVTFNTGFSTQPNKQIRVTAGSTCGTSAMTIYYLLTQFPVTPNPISGPTNVCALIGTATVVSYTTNRSSGAISYAWSVPSNTTVTHPNGSGINDTTINVVFNTGFTGGAITVTAVNGCGTSGTRTTTIVNTPASVPGLISGPTNVCANIAPTGTAATYSVTAVAFATSYTWTTPANTTVTHPNGSGASDYTITVLYPAGFTSGTITVTATNGCGTSAARSLTVTKLNPATPGNIDVIQTHFCGENGGRVFTYSVATMPANATSVQWTVPTAGGAVLVSGQGTTSITVSYPDSAITGTVTAQAVNNCGVSSTKTAGVRLPACPPPSFTGVNNAANSSGQTKNTTATATSQSLEVKIFPNPTVSDFKLEVLTSAKAQIHVRILDGTGRLYKTFTVQPYEVIALGAELKTGAYLVEVRQGETVKTTKVIKF